MSNISWLCLCSVVKADMSLSYSWFESVRFKESEIFLNFFLLDTCLRFFGLFWFVVVCLVVFFFLFPKQDWKEVLDDLTWFIAELFHESDFNKRGQNLIMVVLSVPPLLILAISLQHCVGLILLWPYRKTTNWKILGKSLLLLHTRDFEEKKIKRCWACFIVKVFGMFAAYSVVLRGALCRRKILPTLCRIMKQTFKSK